MSEKQLVLNLDLDGNKVALTIIRATARMGAEHGFMIGEAFRYFDEHPDFPESLKDLKYRIYPVAVVGTSAVEGMAWPIAFEDFIELPETFIDAWLDGVYKVNPQWVPVLPEKETGDQDSKNPPKRKRH